MEMTIYANNIKCEGCIQTIKQRLQQESEIEQVDIELKTGKIMIKTNDNISEACLNPILRSLGYPPK